MLTIYHNPKCSKSRQTLALLEPKAAQSNQEINIVEYLKKPLTATEISQIVSQLNCNVIDMMRTKEAEFTEQKLIGASDEQLINAMANTPKLIERPIVSNGKTAIIGRPPENVLSLFTDK